MSAALSPRAAPVSLQPDWIDRALALAAALLLAAVCAALLRGRHEWHLVPAIVWVHLLTVLVALALTPVMLLRRRGDRLHRSMGWVWAVALVLTAFVSFWVRGISRDGGFSLIHLLSLVTLLLVPRIVLAARRHDVRRHRNAVRGMVFSALLVAGFFTFPFNRLLGHWLIG